MNNNLGIALIGSGYWGKNLVRNFHSLGALRMICDKNDTLLAQFREQYPGVKTCLAFSEVLAAKDVTGVVIATPAETHARLAREALEAGKHIFVEKPLCLDETEGEELATLAKKRGLVLMVGHLLQYHPVFVHLKEMATAGELGRINYIYSNRLNLGKIRREENILWSFAPHDISMILTLAGEEPTAVMATGGNYLHKNIADVTTTHLEFPSGLKAHIFVSWLHPFKEQKLVVVGDKKMAVFDDTRPWNEKLAVYPHQIHWENSMPVPTKAEAEYPEIQESEPLKSECAHFLSCIAGETALLTDGAEGLRVLKILNAAQRSMDQGGCAVQPGETSSPVAVEAKPSIFIHESAYVDEGATIGEGTSIWHFSHIMQGTHIGKDCRIGQNVVIGPRAAVGNRCKIQNNVSVYEGVLLEDEVFCGPSMVFTNVFNPRCHIPRMDEHLETRVGKGATLGANCTIVCGHTIGKYAFIGAGAVVTKDVPDHALVVGNPATQTGWMCECGVKLDDNLTCQKCNTTFMLSDITLKKQ